MNGSNNLSLSIVLPCYNESKNLPAIFRRFDEMVKSDPRVELVLVNNGSQDDSSEVMLREASARAGANIQIVQIPANLGYGHGIIAGLRNATGEFIGWTHADLQTDLNDALTGFARLAAAVDPEKCLLRGRRIGRPLFDFMFTFGMGVISSMALGTRLMDANAQPKIFHRSLLNEMSNPPDDFSLDLYVLFLASRLGLVLIEHPVHFGRRQHGTSKGGGTIRGKLRLILRTWRYIFQLRKDIQTGYR